MFMEEYTNKTGLQIVNNLENLSTEIISYKD